MVNAYLQDSPFTAKQSPENEIAYERLMDVRLKLVDLSFEIDKYHDSYMRFLTQTLNSPDLKNRIGKVVIILNQYLTHRHLLVILATAEGGEEPDRPGADDHGTGPGLGAGHRQDGGGVRVGQGAGHGGDPPQRPDEDHQNICRDPEKVLVWSVSQQPEDRKSEDVWGM